MSFKFVNTARASGGPDLFLGILFILALIGISYSTLTIEKLNNADFLLKHFKWLIVLLVLSLYALSMIFFSFVRVQSKGRWVIKVNEQGIDWQTPDENIEPSFYYKLDEIDKTVIEINRRKRRMGYDEYQLYYIVTKKGQKTYLDNISGVSLNAVLSELEKLGINKEIVNNIKYINISESLFYTPKITTRLLTNTTNNKEQLVIEIENISEHPIKLAESIVTVFISDTLSHTIPLNLSDSELIFYSFTPRQILLPSNELTKEQLYSIQTIQFRLVGDETFKVKLGK